MAKEKSGRAAREEREKQIILKHKFEHRITTVKFGKESLDITDYAGAVKKFTDYLLLMAEVKKCRDIYDLRVKHFDPKKDLTEMLMISHLYFELARMYDAIPQFQEDSQKCLEQFVEFSSNQPYQVVNSELIRKHLKKSRFRNPDAFRNAYQQIFVQSKKCYVVTFCFGEEHKLTSEFRQFKDWLLEYSWGKHAVHWYYRFSSSVVERWENNPTAKVVGKGIFRPLLIVFSKTLLRLILTK